MKFPKPKLPLPCVICGRELETAVPSPPRKADEDNNQPYGGTSFSTHGHYGSTVFDPMDGHFIEINLCDDCLKEAGEKERVVLSKDFELVREIDEGFEVVTGSKDLAKRKPYSYWNEKRRVGTE